MRPLQSVLSGLLRVVPFAVRVRLRLIPGVAWIQRMLVESLGNQESFLHRISAGPAEGLVMRLTLPEDKLYWTGTWEYEIASELASLVPTGGLCFDIGSHRGYMAGVMCAAGAGQVVCFEPNPTMAATLDDLCSLNPELPLRVERCAVGGAEGEAIFELMSESSMGKLADSAFQSDVRGHDRIAVTVRTLDGLIEEGTLPAPDLLKIDIEGAEFDALEGARATIERHRPVLLIEIHAFELLGRCRDWLGARDYEVQVLQGPLASITAENFRVCHLRAMPV